MTPIRSYEDLIAWQKAFGLVIVVYDATRRFPTDERFGMTQQMRRAAVSIPSNIAEGYGRSTRPEYVRFLEIARGSTYELQTQLKIADRLGYLHEQDGIHELVKEVERLLNALIRSLQKGKPGAPGSA